jgi:hypothetical protein
MQCSIMKICLSGEQKATTITENQADKTETAAPSCREEVINFDKSETFKSYKNKHREKITQLNSDIHLEHNAHQYVVF